MSFTELTLARIKGLFQVSAAPPFNGKEEKLLDQLLIKLSCTLDPAHIDPQFQRFLDEVPYLSLARKAEITPSLLGIVERVHVKDSNQVAKQKQHRRQALRMEFAELLRFQPLDLALRPSSYQQLQISLQFLAASLSHAEGLLGRDRGIIPQGKEDLESLQRRIQSSEEDLDSQNLQEVFRIRLRFSLKKLYDWLKVHLDHERTKQIFDQAYQPLVKYYGTFEEFTFLMELLPPWLLDPSQLMLLQRCH